MRVEEARWARRHLASNKRVQRTRLRSPLTRHPLGRKAVWALAVGLLATVPVSASLADCTPIEMSKPVAKIVIPLMKARSEAYVSQGNGKFRYDELSDAARRFEQLFDGLLATRGAVADEALAVLAWFYIGEHPAEEWRCSVLERGRAMLAPLEKWSRCRPAFASIHIPEEDLEATVSDGRLVSEIKRGERCDKE